MKLKFVLFLVVVGLFSAGIMGQSTKESEMKDYSEDHKSIESIIAATYDTISGAKGEKRDWKRFKLLFHPDARLIPTGQEKAFVFSPDQYIERSEPFLVGEGFYETEIASKKDVFGSIAQVFSTYEARRAKDEEKPFMRGINSFQLFFDGKRWWILTIYWQQETKDSPIPAKYLESTK